MAEKRENSVLFSLRELRKIEDDRVQQEVDDVKKKEEDDKARRLEDERRAREEQARVAKVNSYLLLELL